MNLKTYLPVVAIVATSLTGCNVNGGEMSTGIDLKNLDTTAKPGDDFYRYACGGWMESHPLTSEYSRYGAFDQLDENNQKQLNSLISELAEAENSKGSVAQKIGDLYNMAIDSVKRNQDGIEPIAGDLKKIANAESSKELFAIMTELGKQGVGEYFNMYIDADILDSKNNLVQIYQGGLSLGEKEYYLDTDSSTTNIRNKFKEHVVKMFVLAGFDEKTAQNKMESVMKIETEIAKASFSATQQRNPAANFHKMSYADLKKEFAGIDWDMYFDIIGIDSLQQLSVSQIEPLKAVEKIISTENLENQKAYTEWRVLDASANYLNGAMEDENFDFYGKTMSGKQVQQPRWKRAVNVVNSVLGEAVGEMYVKHYFSAAAKERMVNLVANLQKALGERIDAQGWMSDSTKSVAKEKLSSFYVKVGYPDKFKDYSALTIDSSKSYLDNIRSARLFNNVSTITKKYGKPVDKDEWYMTPQTVNAYYNPTTNEICFPAGILQYPFFDMSADDAFNYGAIGVVIGHEMTHGFDDQGRQFDKNGNFTDWWASGDAEKFNERTKVMSNFFSNIEVLPGLMANGALTLGENLADHGGLMVSYQAFKNATADKVLEVKDGYTPEQRFFLAYAGVWASNIREESIRLLTKSDSHSLGRWRVNGALPHIDAWYEAFGITSEDSLFVPKAERVDIW